MLKVFLTVVGVSMDRARDMFRSCSSQLSTLLELCCIRAQLCFDCVRDFFLTVLKVHFDRAPGMFPRCSRYILTVLDVGFDSARGAF